MPPLLPLVHRPATAEELAGADLFPDLRAGFEALGFVVVGGMTTEVPAGEVERLAASYGPEDGARFRAHVHLPDTTLVSPDGSAYVGVSWFWDTPAVALLSLLEDGTLVETSRRWTVRPPGQDRMPLEAQQRLREARRHTMLLVDGDDPARLWDAHRRHVAGRPTVVHDSIELRCALQADQWVTVGRSVRRLEHAVLLVGVLALVLALAGLAVAVTGVGGARGGLAGMVLALLGGALATQVGRLRPRLARAPWLRAEFRSVRAAAAARR